MLLIIIILAIISFALILASAANPGQIDEVRFDKNALITAWTGISIFTIICFAKEIFIAYYLGPQIALTACLICGSASGRIDPKGIKFRGLTEISIVTTLLLASLLNTEISSKEINPLSDLENRVHVLWADSLGSYLLWNYDTPTAKLLFGSENAQLEVINYLNQHGVIQVFTDELSIIENAEKLLGGNTLLPIAKFKGRTT